MNKFVSITLFVVSLFLISCDKDTPEVSSNDVVFYMEGQMGENPMSMKAGVNDNFMHTNYEPDSAGINSYIGTIAGSDCELETPCDNSLTFKFRANNGQNQIDSALSPQQKTYRSTSDSSLAGYNVGFNSNIEPAGGNYKVEWTFSNGETSTSENPTVFFEAPVGTITACMTVTNLDSNTSVTTCNTISPTKSCYADFTYSFSSGGNVTVNAIENGVAPFTYLWDFGNGFMPLNQQPNLNFSGQDTVSACLKIIDAVNCEAVMCKTLLVDSSATSAFTVGNFNYSVSEQYSFNQYDYNEVVVEYVDENGEQYSSQLKEQPGWANFEIIETESYEQNRFGQNTKRLEINCNVQLYNENDVSQKMDFINANGFIGVAHP
ncbi:MAG: PKD domain-containing protein [Salibacter sp.]|uniref:PKD domain-containing protein n=1 Tax=Salibacter sp. TaxID=2010995 RepID=UPI0028701F34|nr:PKD domain-containing protein [Salibacter sp.]MDR9398813.1 PKD domain-containing protein [Salibacter sp.]